MKNKLAFSICLAMMLSSATALAIDANLSGVGGGATVSGLNTNHAYVDTNKINGSVGTTNWTKFNIGAGETVTNRFNAQNQQLLFRVIGDPTKINGTWNAAGIGAATGKTTLINPAGIMVGSGGTINLGSLNMSALDAVNKKAGNIILEKGSNIKADNLNVEGSAIYSAANLMGKSIKLSTKDGVNYDVMPGVSFGSGVAKGDIIVGNSSYQTPDGTLVITSGNNLKLHNVTIKDAKADLSAQGDIVVEAGFMDSEGNADYSMNKRGKFNNSDIKISSDKGNIYLNHIDNQNGSKLTVSSKTGTINNYNNVNSGKSTYTINNEKGDIITQNFHNDGGYLYSNNDTGRTMLINPDNNTTIDTSRHEGTLIEITSGTGEVYISGANNRDSSDFNVKSKGNILVTGSRNQDLSRLDLQTEKGNINFNQILNDGYLKASTDEGIVTIHNKSVINGVPIPDLSDRENTLKSVHIKADNLYVKDTEMQNAKFTTLKIKNDAVFTNNTGSMTISGNGGYVEGYGGKEELSERFRNYIGKSISSGQEIGGNLTVNTKEGNIGILGSRSTPTYPGSQEANVGKNVYLNTENGVINISSLNNVGGNFTASADEVFTFGADYLNNNLKVKGDVSITNKGGYDDKGGRGKDWATRVDTYNRNIDANKIYLEGKDITNLWPY